MNNIVNAKPEKHGGMDGDHSRLLTYGVLAIILIGISLFLIVSQYNYTLRGQAFEVTQNVRSDFNLDGTVNMMDLLYLGVRPEALDLQNYLSELGTTVIFTERDPQGIGRSKDFVVTAEDNIIPVVGEIQLSGTDGGNNPFIISAEYEDNIDISCSLFINDVEKEVKNDLASSERVDTVNFNYEFTERGPVEIKISCTDGSTNVDSVKKIAVSDQVAGPLELFGIVEKGIPDVFNDFEIVFNVDRPINTANGYTFSPLIDGAVKNLRFYLCSKTKDANIAEIAVYDHELGHRIFDKQIKLGGPPGRWITASNDLNLNLIKGRVYSILMQIQDSVRYCITPGARNQDLGDIRVIHPSVKDFISLNLQPKSDKNLPVDDATNKFTGFVDIEFEREFLFDTQLPLVLNPGIEKIGRGNFKILANYKDNAGVQSCTAIVDDVSDKQRMDKIISVGKKDGAVEFEFEFTEEGTFDYWVECSDEHNTGISDVQTINIEDLTPPHVAITAPELARVGTDVDVKLQYSDNKKLAVCVYEIDGVVNPDGPLDLGLGNEPLERNLGITARDEQTIKISCTDVEGFQAEIKTVILAIPEDPLPVGERVAAGNEFSLAIDENGDVWGWGSNRFGQLGLSPIGGFTLINPTKNPDLSKIVEVAAGFQHALALRWDGIVYAWGNNFKIGVGNGDPNLQLKPVKILRDVRQIAAGSSYSLALMNDGTVLSWGNMRGGQLGIGPTSENPLVPVQVLKAVNTPLTNIVRIRAGLSTAYAIDDDGNLYSWGSNSKGIALRTGNLNFAEFALSDVSDVSSALDHVLYVRNGIVEGAGSNIGGALAIENLQADRVYTGFSRAGVSFVLKDHQITSAGQNKFFNKILHILGRPDPAFPDIGLINTKMSGMATDGYHGVGFDLQGRVFEWGHGDIFLNFNGRPDFHEVPTIVPEFKIITTDNLPVDIG